MGNKFTWGDAVIVKFDESENIHAGQFASVCGFRKIDSQEFANKYSCSINDWVYTIEFQDGSDIEIAEKYLYKY